MADAAGVAAITGTATVLSGLVAGWLGYMNAKRQTDVQIKGIKAENERLRASYAEEERRHRQGTYHRMLANLEMMDAMILGWEPFDDETYNAWQRELGFLHAGIHIFGHQGVIEAIEPTMDVLRQVGGEARAGDPNEPYVDLLAEGFRRHFDEFQDARARLAKAMREDVGRDLDASRASDRADAKDR